MIERVLYENKTKHYLKERILFFSYENITKATTEKFCLGT